MALATTALLFVQDSAPTGVLAVGAALVIWTVASWGAAFEQHRHAGRIELARLGAVAAVGAVALGGGSLGLGAALVAGAVASAVWWTVRVGRSPHPATA